VIAPGTCLVIGAGGGIAGALLPLLASSGWNLVLAGRHAETLSPRAAEFSATVETLDATDFDAVAALFARHPSINAAVNLAGSILLKPAHMTTAAEFDQTIAQNLRTSFALVRAAGQTMRKSGGSIVLMSSCAAACGLANHEAIAAAKAGVEGLVRAAAATYAPSNIRFNAVAPGLVDTPLAARITGNEAALRASVAMHPLGRIGAPADIARCIDFLLSPASNWITGQTFAVDGGLSSVRSR
jgi:NAD(P)-dependent dehydrogenase (short-subunit alcohol dehydrogenase family)